MAALQCDICGGKLMGRPGGIFECDSCGMQYDTAWAKAKIQEIKGTVQVEGTVDVKGTVKIDGPVEVKGANAQSMLNRAQLALEDGNTDTAEKYFEKVLSINPKCAEAYFGLAMIDRGVWDLEELVDTGAWNNSNYRRGKQFADASLRNQVEAYEQSYSRRKKEEEEQARIAQEAQEKQEEAERIAREKQAEEDRKREAEEYIVRVQKMKAARERYEKVRYRIAGDYSYIVGLKEDGTVLSSVEPDYFFGAYDVSAWRNIVALDASDTHVVGLKSDGTVVTTRSWTKEAVERWTDMIAVAAGRFFTAGLKASGTVLVDKSSKCDVKLDRVSRWKNIVEISFSGSALVGLDSNGIEYRSDCDTVERDVVALTRSGRGLKADGSVADEYRKKDTREILDEDYGFLCQGTALKADGSVSYYSYGAAQQLENEKNIVAITSYRNGCVGLKANGTIVATSEYDKCKDWKLFAHIDHLKSYKELLAEGRAARMRRETERMRRESGLCQHCGGSFKGLLGKKCTSCGKPKDYW